MQDDNTEQDGMSKAEVLKVLQGSHGRYQGEPPLPHPRSTPVPMTIFKHQGAMNVQLSILPPRQS